VLIKFDEPFATHMKNPMHDFHLRGLIEDWNPDFQTTFVEVSRTKL